MSERHLAADCDIRGAESVADLSDAELLECFVGSEDEAAFAALMARHGPMVLGVCRRLLHHTQDAEDAFQATFLVLVRKAASIGKRELLGNWLYGLALRVAARARDVAAKRRRREATDMERIAQTTREPAVVTEVSATLTEEVQRLPAKYRGPIVLCYFEGRSNEEAAVEMRCPAGTVKTRLNRAREMLRKRLIRRGLVLSTASFSTALSVEALAAPLSPALFDSALKAALDFAAGDAAALGLVSAQVAALTRGVLHTMFVSKLKTLAVLVLALSSSLSGVGAFAYYLQATEVKAKKTDKDRIQGEWKTESAKAGGKDLEDAEGFGKATWTITADKITIAFNNEDKVNSYEMDPAAKPKTINLISENMGTMYGIYKLEGDMLTLCLARERPTEFVSKENSSGFLIVLKRVKK